MFKNAEESQAWSTFFAAQCPRIINAQAKTVAKELEVASTAADVMLEEWRKRQPSEPAVTSDEQKEEEQAAPTADEKEQPKPPKRGRKAKAQKEEESSATSAEPPTQEEAPAEEAPKDAASA